MRKPMSLNEALRTAAALALHVKRDDNQLVGILQYNIAAIDDARCLNNALLILIKFLLKDTDEEQVERLMSAWIRAYAQDEVAGIE